MWTAVLRSSLKIKPRIMYKIYTSVWASWGHSAYMYADTAVEQGPERFW